MKPTIPCLFIFRDLLRLARYKAGKLRGDKWRDGRVKPMTQPEAAEEIGVSMRKYAGAERCEYSFALKIQEQRVIEFINQYVPKSKVKEIINNG